MAREAVLRYWPLIRETAARHGLDPTLLAGLVEFESGGDPRARNRSSGATGLGQVMPREAGFGGRPTAEQLTDPGVNLEWSARILADGVNRYGSEDKGLAAYLGAIDGKGNITGAQDANGTDGPTYIKRVRAAQQSLTGGIGPAQGSGGTTSAAARSATRSALIRFTGTYVMPVDGTITNPFGGKQTYSAGMTRNIGSVNNGTDDAAPAGTVVRAPVGGVIQSVYDTKNDDRQGQRDANENSGWGGQIVIKGDDGAIHKLSHAQFGSIVVQPGMRVEQGQPTHKVGMSGNATGPHVDWEKLVNGKNVDPMQAPIVSSASGGQAYQAALTRLKQIGGAGMAQTAAAGGDTAAAGAGDGGTAVSQTANIVSPLVTEYQRQQQDVQTKLKAARKQLDSYLNELYGAPGGPAGPVGPGGAATERRVSELQGVAGTSNRGLIGDQRDSIKDLEQQEQEVGAKLAGAQAQSLEKQLTPEEKERYTAQTEQIRAETATLRKKLETGGLSPLEAENVRSTIAAREAEVAARDREQSLRERMAPGQIRLTNAQAAGQEWDVAQSMAMLPFNIDRTLAAAGVDQATADKINQLLPGELAKQQAELVRFLQLTPIEVEQGQANVDLTRQRTDELRRTIGPNITAILARAGVDAATAARITQMLPLEMAQSAAETQLTKAKTGQTTAETRLTTLQADAEGERQRRWGDIERQIRDNPNMTGDQLNALILGAANGIQEWATARKSVLEEQLARQGAQERLQERQITQQRADVEQFAAAHTAARGEEAQRTSDVEALAGTLLPGQQGAMRRTAQLAAAAPLVGAEGLRGVAQANMWGAEELQGIAQGFRQHMDLVNRLRGQAGDIRRAPDVSAPAPISMGFTPPTSGGTRGTPSVVQAGSLPGNQDQLGPGRGPGQSPGANTASLPGARGQPAAGVPAGFIPPTSMTGGSQEDILRRMGLLG